MAVDSAGNIVVADLSNRVQVFRADWSFIRQFGSGGSWPGQFNGINNVAVDSAVNIIVTESSGNHRVQVFRADGSFIRTLDTRASGGFQSPDGVAVGPVGNIVVADGDRVQVF